MRLGTAPIAGTLALALALALGVAALATGAPTGSPVGVTLVGDSVADSLSYVPGAERTLAGGFAMQFDLRVCRRLASPGCPYEGTAPPSALETVYGDGAKLGDVLVVDVGYNDDPARYRRGMDDLIQTAGALGVRQIVWVTLRESRPLYRETNAVIRSEARRFPQVEVADWNAGSAGKPWFRPDGLHLTATGAYGLASWLRPYVVRAAAAGR